MKYIYFIFLTSCNLISGINDFKDEDFNISDSESKEDILTEDASIDIKEDTNQEETCKLQCNNQCGHIKICKYLLWCGVCKDSN